MLLLIVSACVWVSSASTDDFLVITSSGPVRGGLVNDDGVSYYAFQGIPYAESPTGQLRFKAPVPKRPWSEVLDVSKPGPACPQPEDTITKDDMSEDCLNVNVFVPANRTLPLPVLVWAHGGTFKANSGNINIMYGPQLLLKQGIIHVSMNYRLGALGYLSLETDEVPGNAGLKDYLLALKWVKNNIHKFGGRTVTIGGQSSGAAMVHHMLLTEKSTGLFDRAILNSGSATNYRFISRHPREDALALVTELGLQGDSDDIILSNLRKADVFDIIDGQENLYKNMRNIMRPSFAPFVPCVEKDSENSILTRYPIDIIVEGIPHKVPILAGMNSVEGAVMWPTLHRQPETFLQEHFSLSIPGDIEYPYDSEQYKNLVDSIGEFYFDGKNLTNWTLDNFYGLLSDTQFTYAVGSWIKIYKDSKNSGKVYFYLFNFDGELNWCKITNNITYPGVVHTDEIGYIFVNKATKDRLHSLDKRSCMTLDNMLSFVANFIKYGDPSPGVHGCTQWPEHDGKGRHLVINDQPTRAAHAPFERRFAFWTNVYKQYNEYLQNGGIRANRIPHP